MNTNKEAFHWVQHCAEKKDSPKPILDSKQNGLLFGYVQLGIIYCTWLDEDGKA